MTKYLGMAIVAACIALPAHAQTPGRPTAVGASATSTVGGGGVGSGASSSYSAGGGGMRLPNYPRTQFGVASVSGSLQDFTPSTFLAYDKALAEGRDILANPPKTIAEVAHDLPAASNQKAKIAVIQDANGDPVIVAR